LTFQINTKPLSKFFYEELKQPEINALTTTLDKCDSVLPCLNCILKYPRYSFYNNVVSYPTILN